LRGVAARNTQFEPGRILAQCAGHLGEPCLLGMG
jgi:hypothetical protein